MKLPMEWLSGETVLTAAEVRKMEPGSKVWVHQCYGRRGEHLKSVATVIQSGRKKLLRVRDYQGLPVLLQITTKENVAYTAVKEGQACW